MTATVPLIYWIFNTSVCLIEAPLDYFEPYLEDWECSKSLFSCIFKEASYMLSFITLLVAPIIDLLKVLSSSLSLMVIWSTFIDGRFPTSYNVSINDSSSSVVIPDNGSSLYTHTFTGLTSNTPYSISLTASNCAGTNTTTVNNYTCKSYVFD